MDDKNKDGIHDEKAEQFLSPDRDPHKHADPAFDSHRHAGIRHGIGVFLVIIGAWWILRDLGVFPDISFGAVLTFVFGAWLLRGARRK